MAGSVNTNINSLAAVQALTDISNSLTKPQSNIQSGLKVNQASDNPAVFTIAQGLRADIGALEAVSDSLATGVATLQGQTTGATSISNSLKTLLETVTKSSGQTSAAAAAANQTTYTNALANIDAFAAATEINGVSLLKSGGGTVSVISNVNGTVTTVTQAAGITSTDLALGGLTLDGSEANTTAAITAVKAAIATVGAALTNIGAGTVKLQGLQDFTSKLNDSVKTGLGAMVDANLSEESAKLASLQTKQSLAIQSLSLANQGPGSLLQLFR